jgi:hypothetical protein
MCIKRCPAFVNTFNLSHEFVQLRLVLNPATFTNIRRNYKVPPKILAGPVPIYFI